MGCGIPRALPRLSFALLVSGTASLGLGGPKKGLTALTASVPVAAAFLVPSWGLGLQAISVSIRFSILSLDHTKTCRSLQTTASFSPSGRDLSALLGSLNSEGGKLNLPATVTQDSSVGLKPELKLLNRQVETFKMGPSSLN